MGKPLQQRPGEKRLLQKLAAEVRFLRVSRGWTQYQLADKAQVHEGTINMLERGRTTARMRLLVAVAGALGVTTGNLCAKLDNSSKVREWHARRPGKPALKSKKSRRIPTR